MQLHPTRATFHVALAGAAMIAAGVASRTPAVIAFGGAMILAVAVGRAIALTTVTRIRTSGFEMVWSHARRVSRAARGGELSLTCELRNRGVDDALGVNVRAIASSMLEVKVEPATVDLPAGERIELDVKVRALRVGRWGVHGLALEVRGTPIGGEGLYEVPLMFANPHGIEVFPQSLHFHIQSPRGGRSRRSHEAGRPAQVAGDGEELRELRDLVPGDPFKRIAWRASAKRGQLVVREMEKDERDVVWLVVDASVELWAGLPGKAPLDAAVDEVASVATSHLARGDQVGLVVAASRLRAWIPPATGPAHAVRLAAALASSATMVDADRTELDETEIAFRVAEHARPLDARGLVDVPRGNLDLLAVRSEALRTRAPFAPRVPFAKSQREQRLRHYLAAFGVDVPPRLEGERAKTQAMLLEVLDTLGKEKKRASIVHVWAPVDAGLQGGTSPEKLEPLRRVIGRLRARRVEVRWSIPRLEESVDLGGGGPARPIDEIVVEAVRLRARLAASRAEGALRRAGVSGRVRVRGGPRRAQATGPVAPPPPRARE